MRPSSFPLLFALAGCSFVPASESGRIDSPGQTRLMVPAVSDQHEFGPVDALRPGQWALYRITHSSADMELRLGVVERRGENVWLEVIEEGNPRRVSLRLVSPDDRVLEARYREVPAQGDPGVIERQPITSGDAPVTRLPPAHETTAERITQNIGQHSVDATRERRLFRDAELGREYREEYVWSQAVPPLLAGSDHGGLVGEESSRRQVRLVDFGEGYAPIIASPQ